ncbi:MAG: hypothetical protein ACREDV_04850 [Methylocella sp.]
MLSQLAQAPDQLAQTAQAHLAQADRDDVAIENGWRPILGKERDLLRLFGVFVEDFDGPAPRRFLAVIDLAKIKNLALRDAAVVQPAVFDHRPCAMFLAILSANRLAQKHDA